MCCDIGPIPKRLLRMAYKRLPREGIVVLVDRFLSEDRTEPLDRIMNQFVGAEFGIETQRDVAEMLRFFILGVLFFQSH